MIESGLSAAEAGAFGVNDLLAHNPIVGEQRKGPKRFWTGREEKLIREHYPTGGINACLEHLPGRTASSIYNRAGVMGLRGPRVQHDFHRQRWSSNEQIDRIITEVYSRAPKKNDIAKLAATIGRPRWWVSKRARTLGIVMPRFKAPPWTEPELEIIATFAHRSGKAIRAQLNKRGFIRSETAIIVQLKRRGHGTGKNADFDHYTAQGLSKLFGVDRSTVKGWIVKGWLKAQRRGTARTEQQGGDEYWIHRRDVRAFVIENVSVVDLRKVEKFWFVELLVSGAR